MPYPLDTLGKADIIRLELVEADAHNHRGQFESPHKQLSYSRHAVDRHVVDDDRPESRSAEPLTVRLEAE